MVRHFEELNEKEPNYYSQKRRDQAQNLLNYFKNIKS